MRVVRGTVSALLVAVLAWLVVPAVGGAVQQRAAGAAPVPIAQGSAGTASAVGGGIGSPGGVAAASLAQDDPGSSGETDAPQGPRLDPEENNEADSQLAQRKIVVGVAAAVLILIVLYGRHVRKKRRNPGN